MKFNIGCGQRYFGPSWIHIDGGGYDHIDSNDIYLKNYSPNSADLIYASHFIEYFDKDEIENILISWKETLKENGLMRIAVPDFQVCAKLYLEGLYPLEYFMGPLYGKMKMGKDFIFHKFAYDYESLKKLLKKIGMRKIVKYDWRKTSHAEFDDHSQAYLPHMEKDDGILISLNVECIK